MSGPNLVGVGGVLPVVTALSAASAAILSATFAAPGPSASLTLPVPVVGGVVFSTFVSGSPTTAAVLLEGSLDGTTWTALPGIDQGHGAVAYPYVRLRCLALSGCTTPTVTASAVVAP